MLTKTITFRVPQGWPEYVSSVASRHGFASRAELLTLALTECVYNTLTGNLKVKGKIEGQTVIMGCRLPEIMYRVITELCCKRAKDTASVWAALAVVRWCRDLDKEDKRQQSSTNYPYYLRDFAQDYRKRVVRLQHEISKNMAILKGNTLLDRY